MTHVTTLQFLRVSNRKWLSREVWVRVCHLLYPLENLLTKSLLWLLGGLFLTGCGLKVLPPLTWGLSIGLLPTRSWLPPEGGRENDDGKS